MNHIFAFHVNGLGRREVINENFKQELIYERVITIKIKKLSQHFISHWDLKVIRQEKRQLSSELMDVMFLFIF